MEAAQSSRYSKRLNHFQTDLIYASHVFIIKIKGGFGTQATGATINLKWNKKEKNKIDVEEKKHFVCSYQH